MERIRQLVSCVCVLFVVAGCVQTASIEPAGPGHPASAMSASVEFTAPPNPFAMPLESLKESADGAGDQGVGEMPGMQPDTSQTRPRAIQYVCPMHADVRSNEPGKCPKCGMKLVPANGEDHRENGEPR